MSLIARLSILRTIQERKMKVTGGELSSTSDHVLLHTEYDVKVIKSSNTGAKGDATKSGNIIKLTTAASFSTGERMAFVVYPEELYRRGIVSAQSVLTPKHDGPLEITLHLHDNLDLANVGPISLYLEGNT
jgi:hypothetical protein